MAAAAAVGASIIAIPAPSTAAALAPADAASTWSAYVKTENAKTGTAAWRITGTRASASGLAGYADHVSARPGERVQLFVNASGRMSATAYRIGWYAGAGARKIWTGAFTAFYQPAPRVFNGAITDAGGLKNAHVAQAPWRASVTMTTTGWPEGFYVIRLDASTRSRYIPLTIRSANTLGRIALVSGIMTNQAYNKWGGYSMYSGPDGTATTRALAVSFDRPYDRELGAGESLLYDSSIVQQAERIGLPVAWLTDYDLATVPGLLSGTGGIAFGGHTEYWTVPTRDAVLQAQQAGTNLAMFGANSAYWRTRLAGQSIDLHRVDGRVRVLVSTKNAGLDPLAGSDPRGTTVLFRNQPYPQPEQALMGARYLCSPGLADWVVTDPAWFGYSGTGVVKGRHLVNLIGPEWDVAARVDEPAGVHVVAYTKFTCRTQATAHTGVYYRAPSGAGVFDAGTLNWPCAIVQRCSHPVSAADAAVVSRVTRNVLAEFKVAKAGLRRPATGDLAGYWLPGD